MLELMHVNNFLMLGVSHLLDMDFLKHTGVKIKGDMKFYE